MEFNDSHSTPAYPTNKPPSATEKQQEHGTSQVHDTIQVHETTDANNETSRRKSFVWDHFKYVENMTEGKCPYCKKIIKCHIKRNGTSALGNHLTNHCRTSPVFKAKTSNKKQKTLEATFAFKNNAGNEGERTLESYSFNQERSRKALARMCIKDNRPFSIVEDEGFVEYVWEINPRVKLPSRWTVARDCLSIYVQEAKALKILLKGPRLSLTTDTWPSAQNINYMCLTAHWVDEDWNLVKKILNFCRIANHKGETIGKLVYACLEKWGVDKIFTVTVDNAASNDGAIRFLKKKFKGANAILDCNFMHLRCCAHIINLVVKDGLEEEHDSVVRIRKAVTFVRSSPSRSQKFEECIKKEDIKCDKNVCLDVETRWNSTYMMLEAAVKYEKAFKRLEEDDLSYFNYFLIGDEEDATTNTRTKTKKKKKRKEVVAGSPSEKDFEMARNFLKFLKIFYKVTEKISGSKYVLGMPISTVASESAFSTGGRVIDPFRSSLTPKTAEALICTQDWIRSKNSKQINLETSNHFSFDGIRKQLEEIEKDELGRAPKYLEETLIED